jgi:curved DNA-binding protein CbpA
MREQYLHVLGLHSSATNDEIRSAYRRLSKKYHPDVNKSPDATEEFIAIKNAYEYLLKTPEQAAVNYTQYTYTYQPSAHQTAAEQEKRRNEERRREARRRARAKAKAKEIHTQELMKKYAKYLKIPVILILLFNTILATDYYLPLNNYNQNIQAMYAGHGSYDAIRFEHFVMQFEENTVNNFKNAESAIVQATPIFNKPMYALIKVNGRTIKIKQLYNVYHFYGGLIPLMFILVVVFFRLKKPLYKIEMAIFMIIPFLIQLAIFFDQ